jgi:hypothetical protein
MRVVTLSVCAALLTGCASSTSSIQAAYVSPATYQSLSCEQIDTEILAVDTKADDLYQRINRRSTNDSIYMGVGLLLAWPALLFLSGGKSHEATQYGQLKGTKDALIAARRDCTYKTSTIAARTMGEVPGTTRIGNITVVPAETPSGVCIIAPANYVGTGSLSRPTITSSTPRCSSLQR